MKIAVFGKTGQVATELARRAPAGINVETIARDRADFTNPDQVQSAALAVKADAVINAVAYTGVDNAETETELAATINGASVAHLAQACADRDLPLIHISTDYVFPGSGTAPWKPGDVTGPQGIYGQTKLMGEEAIQRIGATNQSILRTSWVFSAHGRNFVKTMLGLGAERPILTVVDDQVGGPTPAADIADACFVVAKAIADGQAGGVHHFAGAPDVSWAEFAEEIMSQAHLPAKIARIPSSERPAPATRPLNSRLDCSSLEAAFGICRPDWRQGLEQVLRELAA